MKINGIFTKTKSLYCLTTTLPKSVVTSFLRKCGPNEKVSIVTCIQTGDKVIIDTGKGGCVIFSAKYSSRLTGTNPFPCILKTLLSAKLITMGKPLKQITFDLFNELTNCFSRPKDFFSLMWSSKDAYTNCKSVRFGAKNLKLFKTFDDNEKINLDNIEPTYFIRRLRMKYLYIEILENSPNLDWLEIGSDDEIERPKYFLENVYHHNYIHYPYSRDLDKDPVFEHRRRITANRIFSTIGKIMKNLKHLTIIDIALKYPRFDLIPQLKTLRIKAHSLPYEAQKNLELTHLTALRLDNVIGGELSFLIKLKQLKELALKSTLISESGIKYFKYIKFLTLVRNSFIDDMFFRSYNSPCVPIKYLRIENSRINGAIVHKLKHLVGLSMYECEAVTDGLFTQLKDLKLKYLAIKNLRRVTGIGIGQLKHLIVFKFNDFNDLNLNSADELNGLKGLKWIDYTTKEHTTEREALGMDEYSEEEEVVEKFTDRLDKKRAVTIKKTLFKNDPDKEWIWKLFTKWYKNFS